MKPKVKMQIKNMDTGFEFNAQMEIDREAELKKQELEERLKLKQEISAAVEKIAGYELNYLLHGVANVLQAIKWLHKESRDIGSIAFKCGPEKDSGDMPMKVIGSRKDSRQVAENDEAPEEEVIKKIFINRSL